MGTVLADQKQKLNVTIDNEILALSDRLVEYVILIFFLGNIVKDDSILFDSLWKIDFAKHSLTLLGCLNPGCLSFL